MDGPGVEALGEFLGLGGVEAVGKGGGGEAPEGFPGHGGDVGDAAGDGLSGDEIDGVVRGTILRSRRTPRPEKMSSLDAMVDAGQEGGGISVVRGQDEGGAVVARADVDALVGLGGVGTGHAEDRVEQVGFTHRGGYERRMARNRGEYAWIGAAWHMSAGLVLVIKTSRMDGR